MMEGTGYSMHSLLSTQTTEQMNVNHNHTHR